jgi:hypothetical protein
LFALLGFAVAGTGQAAVTTNTWIPSAFTFSNLCTGESVSVSGDVHLVITSTVTNNTISGTMHSEFKATGIGLVSGLPYQEVVVANSAFSTSLQNGEFAVTFEGVINVIAPGGGNNQRSPIFSHMTLDANGNLTSFRFDFPPVTCQ